MNLFEVVKASINTANVWNWRQPLWYGTVSVP